MDDKDAFSMRIEKTCQMLRQAVKDYNYYFEKVNEMDKLTQDYLHSLELEGLKYDERAKVATKLQKCRQDRRRYKDYVQSLFPLVEMLESERGEAAFSFAYRSIGEN